MQQSTVALNWIMKILQEKEKNTAKVPPLMEDRKENGIFLYHIVRGRV
jgi:hypothetical protein